MGGVIVRGITVNIMTEHIRKGKDSAHYEAMCPSSSAEQHAVVLVDDGVEGALLPVDRGARRYSHHGDALVARLNP